MIVLNKVGPGSRVVIRRSGDVIPKLDRVIAPTEASLPPEGTWVWDGPAATAAHIKTMGVTSATTTAKLHYFLKTLEIPGAGPATASALVEAGITGPAALWAASVEKLCQVLGPKTGASLHANLRTALANVSEATLMVASSTMPRGVGETKLSSLFAACENPNNWSALSAPAGWTSDSFSAFMKEFPTYVAWRKELSWIPYPIPTKVLTVKECGGQVICMTGFRDKELEESATKQGHSFVPSFTGKVTILLVPDGPVKESEKIKAARSKGTAILSRSQFMAQYLFAA
jgi:DNA ligase (NAD+)